MIRVINLNMANISKLNTHQKIIYDSPKIFKYFSSHK